MKSACEDGFALPFGQLRNHIFFFTTRSASVHTCPRRLAHHVQKRQACTPNDWCWQAVVSTWRRTTQKISKMMVRLSSRIAQSQRSFAVDVAERGLPNSDTVLRTIERTLSPSRHVAVFIWWTYPCALDVPIMHN